MTHLQILSVLATWIIGGRWETSIFSTLLTALLIYPILKNPQRYSRFLGFGVAAGLAFMAFALQISLRTNVKNDFLQFRSGAASIGSKDFYGESLRVAREDSLQQNQYPMPFVRLPFYALVLFPLASEPYTIGYIVWQLLSVASLVATALVCWKYRTVVALSIVWSLPVGVALARGQDVGLLLFIAAVAILLFHKRKFELSGVAFGLLAIKWNIVITLPLLLIAFRIRRLLAAYVITLLAIIAASFLVAGANWPSRYFHMLLSSEISPHLRNMPNLWGSLNGWPLFPWTAGLAVLVVLALDWVVIRGHATVEMKMAATLVSSILLVPHVYSYDCAILIPFLVTVAYQTSSIHVRYLSSFLLAPTLYALLWSPVWHFVPGLMLLLYLILLTMETKKLCPVNFQTI